MQDTVVTSINVSSLRSTDAHTRFLSTMAGIEKAFRIPCTIRHSSGQEIILEKCQTHADQGSEMNVISSAMAVKLGLQFQDLASVGFRGLSMQTADHNDAMLHHWVSLDVGVEGLWRTVRCFVGPDGRAGRSHLSLLLGLPWLYAVNAMIDIRGFRILIGDSNIGEKIRAITGPELVFHSDYNLLLYPKHRSIPDRRVVRRTVARHPPPEELEEWATEAGVSLGPLVPSQEARIKVLQLLHQYKHFNGNNLTHLPCTDIITHSVRLKSGTKPVSIARQKTWPAHTE